MSTKSHSTYAIGRERVTNMCDFFFTRETVQWCMKSIYNLELHLNIISNTRNLSLSLYLQKYGIFHPYRSTINDITSCAKLYHFLLILLSVNALKAIRCFYSQTNGNIQRCAINKLASNSSLVISQKRCKTRLRREYYGHRLRIDIVVDDLEGHYVFRFSVFIKMWHMNN